MCDPDSIAVCEGYELMFPSWHQQAKRDLLIVSQGRLQHGTDDLGTVRSAVEAKASNTLFRALQYCLNIQFNLWGGVAALTLALLLLFASASALMLNLSLIADSRRETARMFTILTAIGDTMEKLRAAESSERGFLLTGQTRYRNVYEQNLPLVHVKLDLLDATVRDAEQRGNAVEFRRAVDAKEAVLTHIVQLVPRDQVAASAIVRSGAGLEAMDAVEAVARTMRAREVLLLDQRASAETGDLERATIIALFASASALASAVLGAVLVVRLRSQAAREKAERASAAKTAFLATMSHEIRTPLTAVLGFTERLLNDLPSGTPARSHAERIRTAGSALRTIVNDILDFAKVEAGQLHLSTEPFALAALVDDTVSIVREDAERKGLVLSVEIGADVPPRMVGDPDRLRQILLNLLNNAVKFTAAGHIDLTVRRQSIRTGRANVEFRITDTGIGISASRRHLLFQRFSQVDSTTHRRFGGTGLGLAISKQLVILMGGAIGVESVPDRGSTFWFTVDFAIASCASEPHATPPPAPVRAGRRILVAEDMPLNQELIRDLLEEVGYEVDVVANGRDAVTAVRAGRYDLVLMDVQMPGMDGIAATRLIRKLEPAVASVPIVAVTADVLPQEIDAFRAVGINAHLGKPYQRDALIAAVELWAAYGIDIRSADPSVIDRSILAEIQETLGHARLDELLSMLARELSDRFIFDAGTSDRRRIAYAAHTMGSASGTLGFTQISRMCQTVERACASGDEYRHLLADLRRLAREAIDEIEKVRAA